MSDYFGNNRNKFRKVYNYGLSRRPEMVTFLDTITLTNKTVDSQKFIRDRDFFYIPGLIPSGFLPHTEYIEAKVSFTATEGLFVTFPTPFSANPIVTAETSQSNFTPLDGTADPNVAIWITSVSTNGFNVSFSAPFSGTILYRAVNSPTYPVEVERKPLYPGMFGMVSAAITNFSFLSAVTMSWNAMASIPPIVDTTVTGSTSDGTLDIGIVQEVSGTSFVTADLSTEFIGSIAALALIPLPHG